MKVEIILSVVIRFLSMGVLFKPSFTCELPKEFRSADGVGLDRTRSLECLDLF